MPLALIGLSHKTAPVEVREGAAFTHPGALASALDYLKAALGGTGAECVLLSTCNRTELYVSSPSPISTGELNSLLVTARLRAAAPHEAEAGADWQPYLEERRGHRVIEHLFRVAAGLESMVLGESDIVRQVKEGYRQSADAGICGKTLNALFHEALRVGKRARTETDMTRGAFSVGHAAASLAANIFGSLQGRTVLLLGAGAMSETTARHLASGGASSILVANRTFDRAARLAEELNGRAIHYDEFATHLAKTDIVITSTASPVPVVHAPLVEDVMRARRRRPLFFIDIAVPRDVESAVGDLDGVFLYDIDDLQAVVEDDLSDRRRAASRAEVLVRDEAVAFATKLRQAQTAAPLVASFRARSGAVIDDEFARLRQRLPHLSDADLQAVRSAMEATVNKVTHGPTVKIKEYAEGAASGDEKAQGRLEAARDLLNLPAEIAIAATVAGKADP